MLKLHPKLQVSQYHRQKQHVAYKLGEETSHDMVFNCLTCSRWPSCKDSKKSGQYRCTRYREAALDMDLESILESFQDMDQTQEASEAIFSTTDSDEESLSDLVEKVLNSNIPIPPDLRIKDDEIPLAKNIRDWMMKPEFVGGSTPPFPRQLEWGVKLFGEYCPRCTDMDWWDDMPVDAPLTEIDERVTYLRHGVCPKCKTTKSELVLENELIDAYSLIGVAGQRSSKTMSTVAWARYQLHTFLKLPNPARVYNLEPSTVFTATMTALTYGQAVENMWVPYKNAITQGEWFKKYYKFLDKRGEELGEELYHVSETFARYRHRNIFCSPAGPNKRTMRGKTRLFAACDEFGWFPMNKANGAKNNEFERLDAKGVKDALYNSLFTVRVSYRRRLEEGFFLPKPLFVLISSPQSYNDAIMTAYREAQGSKETLAFKYRTEEFNPQIAREDLEEYFRTDPVTAERDFGCNPPLGESLFLTDSKAVAKCFTNQPNAIRTTTNLGLSKTKNKITVAKVRLATNSKPEYGTILSIDVGLVHNSFAFSVIGVPNDYEDDLDPQERGTAYTPIQVFAVGEIIPKNNTRISLTHIHNDCLRFLCEEFNVAVMVSDRWNNAKISSDLEEQHSVSPYELKAKWEDFEVLRELVYTGNAKFPKLETSAEEVLKTLLDNYPETFRDNPIDHMYWQLCTVKEATKSTVLKPDGGTDDIFRTLVLGASLIQSEEVLDDLLAFTRNEEVSDKRDLGVAVSMSGSGGAGSTLTSGASTIAVMVGGRR